MIAGKKAIVSRIFSDQTKERYGTAMETDFQNAVGKSVGEVLCDLGDFAAAPAPVPRKKNLDLCTLLPDLNMRQQLAFALLAEADLQGWQPESAENFCRRALNAQDHPELEALFAAFRAPDSGDGKLLCEKYASGFSVSGNSYWATCLAIGIDAGAIREVMDYLRRFLVVMMEFAYMEDRNPEKTYAWTYYESFNAILGELTAEAEPEPLPLKVRAIGGSSGKRGEDGYLLSLGVDVENPNKDRMARDVRLEIVLYDRERNVIARIRDHLNCVDPGAVYHYGVTRRIRGAAVSDISADAQAASFLRLSTPIMKHLTLTDLRATRKDGNVSLTGTLSGTYDRPLRSLVMHYQLLSRENRILGGADLWFFDGIAAGETKKISFGPGLPIPEGNKVVCSFDFDASELLSDPG